MRTAIDPWRTPVVLAAGEASERSAIVQPLDLAERAAAAALSEAPGAGSRIDRVEVVGILAGAGKAPATNLSSRLRLSPRGIATTTVGGNSPQWLVGRAADDIAAGHAGAVLIAGAEALRSRGVSRNTRAGGGSSDEQAPDPIIGDAQPGLAAEEMAAGLLLPAHVYPLFESVLAHRSDRDLLQHRTFLGELMAPFSAVASGNPHAWFPDELAPGAISAPSPDNRITAEPYTKRMNAFMNVDQGAAVLVTSLGLAKELGLQDLVVFVWSCADATDVWFVSQRPDLGSSPGIAAASRALLEAAGVGVDDVSLFDIYSCFPSAVEIGASAIGIDLDDPRGLTVTGGLPYFGGPGNNYSTHAIATMVSSLRGSGPGSLGLVSALGWFITKHSIGLYGSSPPPDGYCRGDTSIAQAQIDGSAIQLADTPTGHATVVASTIVYDRDGSPSAAPVVAELPSGHRLVARADSQQLPALAAKNLIGSKVSVAGSPSSYEVVDYQGGSIGAAGLPRSRPTGSLGRR